VTRSQVLSCACQVTFFSLQRILAENLLQKNAQTVAIKLYFLVNFLKHFANRYESRFLQTSVDVFLTVCYLSLVLTVY
jgi:hypothetical protein